MLNDNFKIIYNNVKNSADQLNIEIQIQRISLKQIHRLSYSTSNPDDYFRLALYIPYKAV